MKYIKKQINDKIQGQLRNQIDWQIRIFVASQLWSRVEVQTQDRIRNRIVEVKL
jgi:hypothetical protein